MLETLSKKWRAESFLALEVPEEVLQGGPKNLEMDGLDYRWNVKLGNEINHSIYAVAASIPGT